MARRTVGGGVVFFLCVFGLGCILICGVQYVMWLRYYLLYVFLSKLGFRCLLAVHFLMGKSMVGRHNCLGRGKMGLTSK